ncbi:MAG: hypothetical protein OXE55_00320 [Flavobacteriaceae bacterium]|nr:hypothetical protein [Flavobacteriaceae bacterium]MCY4253758.1 hypothetical protein [Flavobacteriaceae bacterium]
MSKNNSKQLWVFMGLVFLALISRLLPHPPNFAPMTAIALVSGNYFNDKPTAVVLPILAMLITDFFIGFHGLIPVVYLSLLITTIMGMVVSKVSIWNVLLGSIIFFVITNFGVWFGGGYAYTWEGLLMCYTMAIPFLANSIAGDIFYSWAILMTLFIVEDRNYLKNLRRVFMFNNS